MIQRIDDAGITCRELMFLPIVMLIKLWESSLLGLKEVAISSGCVHGCMFGAFRCHKPFRC